MQQAACKAHGTLLVVVKTSMTFLVSVNHPKSRAATDLMTNFSTVWLNIGRQIQEWTLCSSGFVAGNVQATSVSRQCLPKMNWQGKEYLLVFQFKNIWPQTCTCYRCACHVALCVNLLLVSWRSADIVLVNVLQVEAQHLRAWVWSVPFPFQVLGGRGVWHRAVCGVPLQAWARGWGIREHEMVVGSAAPCYVDVFHKACCVWPAPVLPNRKEDLKSGMFCRVSS